MEGIQHLVAELAICDQHTICSSDSNARNIADVSIGRTMRIVDTESCIAQTLDTESYLPLIVYTEGTVGILLSFPANPC